MSGEVFLLFLFATLVAGVFAIMMEPDNAVNTEADDEAIIIKALEKYDAMNKPNPNPPRCANCKFFNPEKSQCHRVRKPVNVAKPDDAFCYYHQPTEGETK